MSEEVVVATGGISSWKKRQQWLDIKQGDGFNRVVRNYLWLYEPILAKAAWNPSSTTVENK